MFLIVGLGNPGTEYAATRHNIGFDMVTYLSDKYGIALRSKEGIAIVGKGVIEGQKVMLVQPQTYMNLSGESVGELARFYKILPEEILVVHDELELPLGTVSLKWSGGLGGHNGLRSMKSTFGTADFWRLRFGLTKPQNRDIADYVLSNFTADEQIILAQEFAQTNEMFAKFLLSTDENQQRILQGWSKRKLI